MTADTVEAMQWLREQEQQKRLADPVRFWRCGKSYVLEAHESEIIKLNEQRMPAYLAAERRRVSAHKAWEEGAKKEISIDRFLRSDSGTKCRATEDEIPVDTRSLISVAVVERIKKRRAPSPDLPPLVLEPEPPTQPFEDAECLWARTTPLPGEEIVRAEGTKRYEHD